jgi:hypothetical protein
LDLNGKEAACGRLQCRLEKRSLFNTLGTATNSAIQRSVN